LVVSVKKAYRAAIAATLVEQGSAGVSVSIQDAKAPRRTAIGHGGILFRHASSEEAQQPPI
jgi:hypothetical protein